MSLKWDKVVIKKPVKCTNKELAGKKTYCKEDVSNMSKLAYRTNPSL